MLIALIPAPIHHFRQGRVVCGTFKGVDVGQGLDCSRLESSCGGQAARWGRRSFIWFRSVFLGRRVGFVVEQLLATWASILVDDEEIELIVL